MRNLILITLIVLCSCKKERQEKVTYSIYDYENCTQVNITYKQNGKTVTQSNVNPSGWQYEFMRSDGSDIYFKVAPTCGGGEVDIQCRVNDLNLYNDLGTYSDPAVIEASAKTLDDLFK
jgi:hypothetical protein